jgi:hypothetical protein
VLTSNITEHSARKLKKKILMKRLLDPMKVLAALALVALAVGCATQQQEKLLSEAGFRTSSISTPEGQKHLKTLTPDKVTSVQRSGKVYYIFPDAAHNRLYIGDQTQYQKYRQLRSQQKLAEEEIAARVDTQEDKMLHHMLEGWD